jgi:glycosyltransferase involved in cell wall biosynthesis
MAKISIICPVYNHEGYIEACLDSVINQTVDDWELIIIDDGSTDGTANKIAKYRDARVRYYWRENQGIVGLQSLYNEALSYATGEFIAIVEGDDFWPLNRLATLLDAMDKPDIVLAYGMTQFVDETGGKMEQTIPHADHLRRYQTHFSNTPYGVAVREMLKHNVLWPCSVSTLIRREELDKIGGFQGLPNGAIVDRPTFFELGLKGAFKFVPEVTGFWRQYRTSSTKSHTIRPIIAEGTDLYMRTYLARHAVTLRLSRDEVKQIITYWYNTKLGAKLAYARVLLKEHEYKAARCKFLSIVLSGKPRFVGPAMLGWILSYLHCDLEWIYRIFGRKQVTE